MKWRQRLLVTAGLSAAVAVCMSLLPQLDPSLDRDAKGHVTSQQALTITDRNLVDLLVQVPLQLRIRKVELNHATLSIDLNLPKNVDEAAVYRDLYAIAQATISRTSNVNQVLVRVMDYSVATSGTSAQLVVAMDADRDHAKNLDARIQEVSTIMLEQQVKARFHLTYTPRWQQRYPL
jgi:hypothetical protein